MAEDGKYKIKIETEADLQQASALGKILDSNTAKAKKLNEEIRTIPAVDPNSTLATGSGGILNPKRQKTAAQLRAEEKAAGLRTERSMKLEDEEAERRLAAKSKFLQDTGNQRKKTRDAINNPTDVEGGSFLESLGNVKSSAIATLAALAGVIKVVSASLGEYSRRQKDAAELEGNLANRGLNIKAYREQVQKLASEQANSTGKGIGVWTDAISQLTQNGAGPDQINVLVKAVENLAGTVGGDIPRASLALSKAMQGNFDSLREWGIVVPKAGTQAEKFAAVLDQTNKGAGILAATSATLDGRWQTLKNSTGDLLSATGAFLTKALGLPTLMNAAAEAARDLAKAMGGATPEALGLSNALVANRQNLQQVAELAAQAAANYNSVAAASDRATASLNRQRSAQEQILNSQNQLADSAAALENAQIDFAEATGNLTPQQARARRAGVSLRSASGRFMREQAADDETIRANERRENQIGNQVGLLQGREQSLAGQNSINDQRIAARSAAADAENKVELLKQELAKLQSSFASDEFGGRQAVGTPEEIAKAQAALNLAQGAATRAGANASRLGPLDDSQASNVAAELAQTRKALLDLTTVIQNTIPGMRDSNSSTRLRMDTRTEAFRTNQAAEALRNLTSAIEDINRRLGNR